MGVPNVEVSSIGKGSARYEYLEERWFESNLLHQNLIWSVSIKDNAMGF